MSEGAAKGASPYLQGSGLAKRLAGRPIPAHTFEFAGADGRFVGDDARWCVRALSAEERIVAIGEALEYLVKTCGWNRDDFLTELGDSVWNLECKVRALLIGLVDPDDARKPFAGSAAELRRLEADEIERLWQELSAFTEERSPLSRAADGKNFRADVEELISAVGKGVASPTKLRDFDYGSLLFITLTLASRLYGPTRASSSPTSPSNDSSDPPIPTTD